MKNTGRNIEDLIDSLDEATSKKNGFNSAVERSLEVIANYNNLDCAAVYLVNEDNLDFESFRCLPKNKKAFLDGLFDQLVLKEKIGEAVETEKTVLVNLESDKKTVLVKSLEAFNKTLGVAVSLYEKDTVHQEIIDKFEISIKIYSQSLHSILLSKDLQKTNALLEQKVAVRTMSIAHSKRELQTILNAVETGILAVKPENGEIFHSNSLAAELINDKAENIIGSQILNFFEKPYKDKKFDFKKTPIVKNRESSLIKSDKSSIPVLRSTAAVTFGDQKIIIESFIDISGRKKIEEKLKKTNERLEQKVQDRTEDLEILVHKLKDEVSSRKKIEEELRKSLKKEKELGELKSRFVSIVSHEFRTPLTIISSAAQILLKYRNKLNEEEKDNYLTRILQTIDALSKLMENVIFIGKSDVQLNVNQPEIMNLKEFSEGLIKDVNMGIDSERLINFNYKADSEVYNLDERILRQILINLLTNAIKYSPKEKPIDFEINSENDKLVLAIKDFGIGIPKNESNRIFEQFYRAQNAGAVAGTGLGMSVIKKSLDLVGGKIDFESELNKGTKFTVEIPI